MEKPSRGLQPVVCTLYEGEYHYGVGALTNSLYHHGFRGDLWVGYRGELPPWIGHAEPTEYGFIYPAADDLSLHFILIEEDIFFAHYKARFIIDLLKAYEPNASQFFYFDPDIVVKCRWSFFEEWANHGIALCIDGSYPIVPPSHPWRHAWQEYIQRNNLEVHRSSNWYFNSGFIGLNQYSYDFLSIWEKLTTELRSEGIDLTSFNGREDFGPEDRTHPFFKSDQDTLNAAVMATDTPVSAMGTDAMDFTGAGFTMSHAVDAPKPWQKSRIANLLIDGRLPSLSDREFLRYVDGPVVLYSPWRYRLKLADYYLSKGVGSIFHRH